MGNPIRFTDPKGLAVYLCKRPVDLDQVPDVVSENIPYHHWIKTDTKEAGMGGDCPIPKEPKAYFSLALNRKAS